MYPQPYLEYLVQFHAERDYFECHEILEEYWKSEAGQRSPVWVGLIQIAVGLYHHRRGNRAGAVKMMNSALRLLRQQQDAVSRLGLDPAALLQLLAAVVAEMEAGAPYRSISLPIADPELRRRVRQMCAERGLPCERPSDMANRYLLHKHTLRDRSGVIAERARQLSLREQRKPNG
jgi:uncharacterized protein